MEVYKFYPAVSDIRSSASSASVLADSQLTLSAADSSSASDSCVDVTRFGDTRRMVHCLAEHVVYGDCTTDKFTVILTTLTFSDSVLLSGHQELHQHGTDDDGGGDE